MAKDDPVGQEWPKVEFEPRPWKTTGDVVASRRALRAARGDYYAAVPPMIAGQPIILSPDVLALSDDASRELTRFDAEAGLVAAPFASILLRTESASSSEVENLTSSAKQVALAEIGESLSGNASLVVANVRAIKAAIILSDRLDESAIIEMHEALLSDSAPAVVGPWRDEHAGEHGGELIEFEHG